MSKPTSALKSGPTEWVSFWDTASLPLKQVYCLHKAYYEKPDKFTGKRTDEFGSELNDFNIHLGIQAMDKSIWVGAFPIMLTERAIFSSKIIMEPKYDLVDLKFDHFVDLLKRRHKKPELNLWLMDECNNIILPSTEKFYPTASLKYRE